MKVEWADPRREASAAEAEDAYDACRRQQAVDAKLVAELRKQLTEAEVKLRESQADTMRAQITAVALKNNVEAA